MTEKGKNMISYDKTDSILCNIARIAEERIGNERDITFKLDLSMDEYEGQIKGDVISAGSYSQLLETFGRLLRKPDLKEGSFHSAKRLCGMYFATHFKNYLHAAPLPELFRYIDDLALWGMNVLRIWFDLHHYKNMEDGKEDAERFAAIMRYAKSIGIKTAMTTISNEAFKNSPSELRADWTCGHDGYKINLNDHYHVEICPSAPGGIEKILEYRKEMLEVFKDLEIDYICIGPYDEGGCTCSECAPWGANGYIKTIEALIPLYKEYFPKAEFAASFWQFWNYLDDYVEYKGFYKAIDEGRLSDLKYIEAEPEYCSYIYERPLKKLMFGFPEISMWRANPWGGYGANPMPKRLGESWEKDGDKLEGGFPYCEGLYEDINKVIMLRLYRDNQSPEETIKEYLRYEFGFSGEILEELTTAIFDMEETLPRQYKWPFEAPGDDVFIYRKEWNTHRYPIEKPEKAESIEKTFKKANELLNKETQKSAKWKMLYLRALIDGELVRNDFCRNDKIMGYFNDLISASHLEEAGFATKPDVHE